MPALCIPVCSSARYHLFLTLPSGQDALNIIVNRCLHALRFTDPLFLLALAAGLIAFVVQSGELGTADTQHRLQSAHAFWTSEPPVFPGVSRIWRSWPQWQAAE